MLFSRSVLQTLYAISLLWPSSVSTQTLYTRPCPLLDLNYAPPSSYASSSIIQSAVAALAKNITQALENATAYGQIDSHMNAFSIDIYSVNDAEPLFNYHHTPEELIAQHADGVTTVDSDSIYRIGSISKMLTVYIYLIAVGDGTWNQQITKFVPELADYAETHQTLLQTDSVDLVDWESITIGSLASHMSGISREEVFSPAFEQVLAQTFSLPPPLRNESSVCGDSEVIEIPCDRTAFFADFLRQRPFTAPFQTPIYSNVAFQILGYAIENITGTTMADLFNRTLVQQLNLNSTYYTVPPTPDTSFIPINTTASLWYFDARGETPTGGNFASINDLRSIGRSILNSTLLPPAQNRRWLKPYSFTTNVNFSVGAPWEILRAPGEPVSWIYSKTGAFGAYAGIVALLPQYNIGFTVLGAGSSAAPAVSVLSDIIVESVVPAVYSASKAAASTIYAGTYSDCSTNSSITISTSDTDPGLIVSNWTFNGTQFLPLLGSFLGVNATTQVLNATLYRSGLVSNNGTRVSWRALFRASPQILDPGIFSENCVSWASVNTIAYDGVGFDEFVFILDINGNAVRIEPRIIGLELLRVSGLVYPQSLQRTA